MATLRQVQTPDLTRHELASIRSLCDAAYGGPDEPFSDEDWQHALGGVHIFIQDDGDVIAHGSVVPRTLHTGGIDLATGYVEAVATSPPHQGRGHGTKIMRAVGAHIDQAFPLGAPAHRASTGASAGCSGKARRRSEPATARTAINSRTAQFSFA